MYDYMNQTYHSLLTCAAVSLPPVVGSVDSRRTMQARRNPSSMPSRKLSKDSKWRGRVFIQAQFGGSLRSFFGRRRPPVLFIAWGFNRKCHPAPEKRLHFSGPDPPGTRVCKCPSMGVLGALRALKRPPTYNNLEPVGLRNTFPVHSFTFSTLPPFCSGAHSTDARRLLRAKVGFHRPAGFVPSLLSAVVSIISPSSTEK